MGQDVENTIGETKAPRSELHGSRNGPTSGHPSCHFTRVVEHCRHRLVLALSLSHPCLLLRVFLSSKMTTIAIETSPAHAKMMDNSAFIVVPQTKDSSSIANRPAGQCQRSTAQAVTAIILARLSCCIEDRLLSANTERVCSHIGFPRPAHHRHLSSSHCNKFQESRPGIRTAHARTCEGHRHQEFLT